MPGMKSLLLTIALVAVAGAQAQSFPVCRDASIRWKKTEQKMNDSSLNGTYSYAVADEGLNRFAQGLGSYLAVFEAEASTEVDSLCFAIDRQQSEINELKAEIESLKRTVSAMQKRAAK